jgi:lysophospholipase L1-like esterase
VAPRYLALGDSFTIGTGATPERSFPARLADRWKTAGCAVEIKNVAVNGYTTGDLIEQELPVVPTFHPTFVTIAIGANDIVRGGTVEAYRANLRRIFDAVKGARVVVIPQPDWSRSPTAAAFGTPDQLVAKIRTFNTALAEEAAAHGASYVDLFPLMLKQADARMVATDGLHPSADAYDAWAAQLATTRSPCES